MKTEKQKRLIEFYKQRLAKVKKAWDPKYHEGRVSKDRCNDYIKFAKSELKKVKQGRAW